MKNKLLISVLVPAYNEEKRLKSCLDSLKKQNFPVENYEIIVVDNASTDKTSFIASQMGVKVVEEEKRGYVFALKKGFSVVRGEIIALTDADSLVPINWLTKINETFQKDKKIVLVGGPIHLKPTFPLAFLSQSIMNLSFFLSKTTTGTSLAIRKDIYEKIGGVRDKINYHADTDLCLRAKKEGKIVFLWHNPVTTSSRHFQGWAAVPYMLKGIVNFLTLIILKKTLFFHFGDARD